MFVQALLLLVILFYAAKGIWHAHGGCKCCRVDKQYSNNDTNITLQPVMNPLFNLREVCKQSILLEDHMTQPTKRCVDCMNKHCLTIEALGEEAVALDKTGKHLALTGRIAPLARRAHKSLLEGTKTHHELAQEFRALRKKLVPFCANQFRAI